MVKVHVFSKERYGHCNEDSFDYNSTSYVIADGATDKSGKVYSGKTGGELVAQLIVHHCLSTNFTGVKLVHLLNQKVHELYVKYHITDTIKDAKYRFSCGFICVRYIKNKLVITYLGDLGFRINGTFVYQNVKKIDVNNAKVRSKYIQKTDDIKGSRDIIMPLLLKQFDYQNKSSSSLGYGVIDGTKTPTKYIKTFEYDLKTIKTVELFTDGYFDNPSKVSIDAWERMYKKIEKEDPDKWKKYKSTKSADDRTIMIIEFKL